MKFQTIALTLGVLSCGLARADEPFRIEVGKNYESYSNEELRRRVWQLERAVFQLQQQVFQLAVRGTPSTGAGLWTCRIQSFTKTYVASGETRSSALAQVLKKCGDATNPIHCRESDVDCSNE